ncbi:hypothetical protein Gohar_006419 [Gossypium harknessii]|uniref:Uncharacterized protein n=1 Tax=Gossypium harknessii TaxID=34285 RepID=A0A7J9GDC9_9ROSI|nr:hypothetical protein [Gossypium harknessii]
MLIHQRSFTWNKRTKNGFMKV